MYYKPILVWLYHLLAVWSLMCLVQAGWGCTVSKDFGARKAPEGKEGGLRESVPPKAAASDMEDVGAGQGKACGTPGLWQSLKWSCVVGSQRGSLTAS